MIKLGNRVRDIITGFEGLAACRTEWMTGCARIGIEPTELYDGKPIDIQTFDEDRVEVVETTVPDFRGPKPAKPGGPRPDPVK